MQNKPIFGFSMQKQNITALVSLLDDPDMEIQHDVREKILAQGSLALPYLDEAIFREFNSPTLVRYIERIIQEIKVADAMTELKSWFVYPEKDMAKGWFKFSKIAYEEQDIVAAREELDNLKKLIWLEMNPRQTSFEKAKTLNYLFFDVFGFRIDQTKNAVNLLPDVLVSRSGSPLAVAALYSHLAYSNHFPVHLFSDNSDKRLLGCIDQSHIYRMLYGYPNLGNALFFMDICDKNEIVIPPNEWSKNMSLDNNKIQPMAHSTILLEIMQEYNDKDQNEMRKSVCKQHLQSVNY